MEHPEEYSEGEEIIDRADRTDDHHELANEPNLPSLGPVQQGGINIVAGDADLGNVIEEVVQQYLSRQHRQEGQEEGWPRHAEHVAEVRTRTHDDVLHDVGEGAPPFVHSLVQHRKILLQQNDFGSVFGHLHSVHDGNANIRRVQRRRIVDAVTYVPDDMATSFKSEKHPGLLFRGHAGEDGTVLGLVGQSGIVHRIDLVPRENAVPSQPNVMGDLLGHILVVAGHDKYGNTILFQRLKNGMNPLLWLVEECCKSDQRHVVLRCRGVDILLFYLLHCDAENAVPVGTQLLEGLCCVSLLAFIEGLGTPIDVDGLADGKDALSLALSDEEMLVTMPHHHGKAFAVEVEGYLVHLFVLQIGRASCRERV